MALLNFTIEEQIPLIEKGIPRWKRQSIRAERKRPIKKDEKLYLYTGLRTKKTRKLGEAICMNEFTIRMDLDSDIPIIHSKQKRLGILDDCWISDELYFDLAYNDGFDSIEQFWSFFQKHYRKTEIRRFQVIQWGELL